MAFDPAISASCREPTSASGLLTVRCCFVLGHDPCLVLSGERPPRRTRSRINRFRMPIANPDPASPKLRTVLCSAEFELPPADTDTLAGALDDNYGPPDERDGTGRSRAPDPGRPDPHRDTAVRGVEWHTAVRQGDRGGARPPGLRSSPRPGNPRVTCSGEAANCPRHRNRHRHRRRTRSPGPGGTATESPFLVRPTQWIADALAEFTADSENRWLEMELPALAGLTPAKRPTTPPGARISSGCSTPSPASRKARPLICHCAVDE